MLSRFSFRFFTKSASQNQAAPTVLTKVIFLSSSLLIAPSILGIGCKKDINAEIPTQTAPAPALRTVAIAPAGRQPSANGTQVLGSGWYPQIEVDAEDNIHIAYTDADLGDLFYVVGKAKNAQRADQIELSAPQVVAAQGATGAHVRLALAPSGVPFISYYNQDRHTLRLAYRPADMDRLAQAGVKVGAATEPESGTLWHSEDIAFGDEVGTVGMLKVDQHGTPHVVYTLKGSLLRYATRPKDAVAVGQETDNQFMVIPVDDEAGMGYHMHLDMHVDDVDGQTLALIGYSNWNYTDAQLRWARIQPTLFANYLAQNDAVTGQKEAVYHVNATKFDRSVDGWSVSFLPQKDANLLSLVVSPGINALWHTDTNMRAPDVVAERKILIPRVANAVAAQNRAASAHGTLFVLGRVNTRSSNDVSGLYLYTLTQTEQGMNPVGRTLLESNNSDDSWFDVAALSNGRAIAVWHAPPSAAYPSGAMLLYLSP